MFPGPVLGSSQLSNPASGVPRVLEIELRVSWKPDIYSTTEWQPHTKNYAFVNILSSVC